MFSEMIHSTCAPRSAKIARLGVANSNNPVDAADRWAYQHQANRLGQCQEQWRADFEHGLRFYRALLGEHLPADKDGVILDLPCGEGQMLYTLRRLGYRQIEGFDLDPNRVEVGRRLGLPTGVGDVFGVLENRIDSSVGCCLSMDFVEHVEKEQVVLWLELVHRKLQPGGRFIARTPCADSPFGARHIFNDFTHKWAATSGVLRGLMEGAGFRSISVFGEHPKLGMAGALLRVPLFHVAAFAMNFMCRALNVGAVEIWTPSMWAVGTKA